MAAPASPPNSPRTPTTTTKIDPTPRQGDKTSFEQFTATAPNGKIGADMEGDLDDLPDPRRRLEPKQGTPPKPAGERRSEPVKKQAPEAKEPPKPTPSKDDDDIDESLFPDVEGDLSKIADEEDGTQEDPKPKKKDDDDDKDDQDTDEEGDEKEPAKEQDDEEQDKALDAEIEQLGPLKSVRKAHKEALRKIRALEGATTESKRQVETLEKKLKQANETGLAADDREKYEKQINDYEETIRTMDYKRSKEYNEKYVKPLEGAIKLAMEEIEEMEVIAEDGTSRQATQADLQRITSIANMGDALNAAKRMFGDMAQTVMDHRRNIRRAHKAAEVANADASNLSKEAIQKQQEKFKSDHARREKLYTSEVKELQEGPLKHVFGERDKDDEGNALLKQGWDMVNALVDDDGTMPEGDRIKTLAKVRSQAASFMRVLRDNKSLRGRVKELKQALKEYEESEPKPGLERGGKSSGSADEWKDNLESYADKEIA
jgi:hypothetical protein